MRRVGLLLVFLVFVGHGRRLKHSQQNTPRARVNNSSCLDSAEHGSLKALATILHALKPSAAFNPCTLGGADFSVGTPALATSRPALLGRWDPAVSMSDSRGIRRPALLRAGLVASALSAALVLAPPFRRHVLGVGASFWSFALGLYHAYDAAALTNPLPVKSATSAVAYLLGDLLAQKTAGGAISKGRLTRATLAGGISHGPQLHYWTLLLDRYVSFGGAPYALLVKVFLDQTIFSLYLNGAFTMFTEVVQKRSLRESWNKVRATAWTCLKAGWKFWPAAHLITYGIIPLQMRVLWVDVLEIVWVAILSTKVAKCGPSNLEACETTEDMKPSEDWANVITVQEEEPERIRKVFDQYDKDGSGAIDLAELEDMVREMGGKITSEQAKWAIKQLDKDGSSTVDFKEFLAWWYSEPGPERNSSVALAFMRMKMTAWDTMVNVKQALTNNTVAVTEDSSTTLAVSDDVAPNMTHTEDSSTTLAVSDDMAPNITHTEGKMSASASDLSRQAEQAAKLPEGEAEVAQAATIQETLDAADLDESEKNTTPAEPAVR